MVGGGNSAGQAVVYLAEPGRQTLAAGARCARSRRPCRAIWSTVSAALANVELVSQTEVVALEGTDGMLEAVHWRTRRSGEETRRPDPPSVPVHRCRPNTAWLSACGVALDHKGFVLTGADAGEDRRSLETSRRGVLCNRRYPRGLGQARRGRRRRRRAGGRSASCLSRCAEAGRGSACRGTREAAGVIVIANAPRPG